MSLSLVGYHMKVVGLDQIDYWQGTCDTPHGLRSRFGVRVRQGRCWALVQIRDEEARTFGEPHEIPFELSTVPEYLRMIVDNHQLTYPDSDLIEVLAGRKSIRE